MPLDQDDIILGEKTHYYCSSSESEPEPDETDQDPDNPTTSMKHGKLNKLFTKPDPEDDNPWSAQRKAAARAKNGRSNFTGPKGVIEDQKNFGKDFAAQRIRENLAQQQSSDQMTAEERFFEEYRKKRLQQLQAQFSKSNLENLNGGEQQTNNSCSSSSSTSFLSENLKSLVGKYTDVSLRDYVELTELTEKWQPEENFEISVFIHLYDEEEFLCDIIDDCFESIASRTSVLNTPNKGLIFVKVRAADMGTLSERFISKGVPCIQIFRNNQLLSTSMKMEIVDSIGEDFTCDDFLRFLKQGARGDVY